MHDFALPGFVCGAPPGFAIDSASNCSPRSNCGKVSAPAPICPSRIIRSRR
jgi:hypothetical protein